jgi:cytoskeletal protein CcmA (bactofilin family)
MKGSAIMFGKKHSKPQNRIDCLIGAGTVIEGNITFTGGLRVDGHVKGNIVATAEQPGTLVLSEHAQVDGEIHVSHAVINGKVTGPIQAVEYLELQGKAMVSGEVRYKALEMHLGAVVQGRLMHESTGKSEKIVQFKPVSVD